MVKTKRCFSGLLLASAVCVPLGNSALANDSREIEEVIITAERKEGSVQDTSISITAFTDDSLDDFGIRNQEDLQNFVPAMTIQPYDATVRGVGRNFRSLGGDPGVAAYINGAYSEDLLTATAPTFWDVQRIEVLRGPQGTLYGRNAVGGAINILYHQPDYTTEWAVKTIQGNFGTKEYYGMASGALIENVLAARINFARRDRDGVIEEIGPSSDLDGLGTENIAVQFKWNVANNIEINLRQNEMKIDRSFGGASGGGLVVLNEENSPMRNTESLVPGFRFVDPAQTNGLANDYLVADSQVYSFTNPKTGEVRQAQHNRPGVDYADFNGTQNAAASLDGFNYTSPESAAAYNECVFGGDIKGDDVCAATNGLNREEFDQRGTQFSVTWNVSEDLELNYIYGLNKSSYRRTTDDDNTASQFHDRQFYVNHEADYSSHELQAFYDFSDTFSITSGIFFYDANIDQRGDFYSSLNEARMTQPYEDNTSLSAGAAAASGLPEGISATALLGANPMATLFSAKKSCQIENPSAACAANFSVNNKNTDLEFNTDGLPTRNDNLYASAWSGDDGTTPGLNVIHGPDTQGSDVLYATRTERDAFAAYSQAVWDIDETFTVTFGIRYAKDEVKAEENLFRYNETGGDAKNPFRQNILALYGGLVAFNQVNGGLVTNEDGSLVLDSDGQPTATETATNGGIPYGLSAYRPYERKDTKVTGRINLDWNVNEDSMMYFSATSGYRSGGYNLVFFSQSPTYEPETLLAYEIGYKAQFMDNSLQLNSSVYYYDYETIHTVATEVSSIGGTTTSVLAAPGAEIYGVEAELMWLVSDNWTFGGNFSYTPSEYTEDLFVKDTSNVGTPTSLYPEAKNNYVNIKGNKILQVPEAKATAWASYMMQLDGGSSLELFGVYTWIDDVYYSAFESEAEKAPAYARADLRATWTSATGNMSIAAFVNNISNDVGILQIVRNTEEKNFRQSAGTTLPRMFGVEFKYAMGQ
ncbi:MAG: outer membrane receptor protein involved in Fe transport [Porticoccaceae bacterium]|jgi:outer membrane receptor protein involved in Fe transport